MTSESRSVKESKKAPPGVGTPLILATVPSITSKYAERRRKTKPRRRCSYLTERRKRTDIRRPRMVRRLGGKGKKGIERATTRPISLLLSLVSTL